MAWKECFENLKRVHLLENRIVHDALCVETMSCNFVFKLDDNDSQNDEEDKTKIEATIQDMQRMEIQDSKVLLSDNSVCYLHRSTTWFCVQFFEIRYPSRKSKVLGPGMRKLEFHW